MQTFLVDTRHPKYTAKLLDKKRCFNQINEATVIARRLLHTTDSSAWRSHPAVLQWQGYEYYLVEVYMLSFIKECLKRGYNLKKCLKNYKDLSELVKNKPHKKPHWINEEFVKCHKSRLVQKNYEFYKPLFSDVPINLEYIWGV